MRVLILNWRDLASPGGGGAERVTHEIARRLVARGHAVTWLSSRAEAVPSDEVIDGIEIVRRGSELTTRLHAPRLARRGFDVVVDAINTVPYLAPLWARVPSVVFFHQLARDVWWYEAPFPLSAIGFMLEPVYLQAYRRTPAITVSPSTRDDLRRFGHRATIDVIPLGAGAIPSGTSAARPLSGRLVAIGRLTPSKRFDHAVAALALLRETHPDARLDIIGTGPERDRLEQLVAARGLAGHVTLHGRIDDDARDRLLAEADAAVGTSVREGWGLTVTEAALVGTPSVVYDIPGFRDAVVDRRTGLVTSPTPAALAQGIRDLIGDRARYARISAAACTRAQALSWDSTADAFELALQSAVSRGS